MIHCWKCAKNFKQGDRVRPIGRFLVHSACMPAPAAKPKLWDVKAGAYIVIERKGAGWYFHAGGDMADAFRMSAHQARQATMNMEKLREAMRKAGMG